MSRGHHIHAAKLQAENEQLKNQINYNLIVHHPPDKVAALERRVRQLEEENRQLMEQNEKLIKLANLY